MPLNMKSGCFARSFVQLFTVGHWKVHDSTTQRTGKVIVRLKFPIISIDSMHFYHGNLIVLYKNIKISIYCAAADFIVDTSCFQINLISRRMIGVLLYQIQNHLPLFRLSALFQGGPTSFPIDHIEKGRTRSEINRCDRGKTKFCKNLKSFSFGSKSGTRRINNNQDTQ